MSFFIINFVKIEKNMEYKSIVKKFRETGEGFDVIYNNIYNSLKYFIYGYVKDEDVTKDIISQTMIVVYENFHKYDETLSELNTWIFAIAKNECLSFLKKSKRTISLNKKINDSDSDEFIDIVEPETKSETINENKLQLVFNEIFNKIGRDSISGKILYYKYVDKLTNNQIVAKINKKHVATFNSLNEDCELNKENKKTHFELKQRRKLFVKEHMINEMFVKNNLKKTEKVLYEHFKNINIENIFNLENI